MFNYKQFEDKVYGLVTGEINKAFSTLLKSNRDAVQVEGIKLHKQVMEALHYIAEEVAAQILYGLLANAEVKKKKC
jgi:hypothetical protein